MKHDVFLQQLDHPAITAAIAAAERRSSGQIRVFISRRQPDDALAAARARFAKLGMEKTVGRNGVLVYFAPRARQYAIVGDQGIHERCGGDEFWQDVVGGTMQPLLKAGKFTEAIVAAVAAVGDQLAAHFPQSGSGSGSNELPDEIETD